MCHSVVLGMVKLTLLDESYLRHELFWLCAEFTLILPVNVSSFNFQSFDLFHLQLFLPFVQNDAIVILIGKSMPNITKFQ